MTLLVVLKFKSISLRLYETLIHLRLPTPLGPSLTLLVHSNPSFLSIALTVSPPPTDGSTFDPSGDIKLSPPFSVINVDLGLVKLINTMKLRKIDRSKI